MEFTRMVLTRLEAVGIKRGDEFDVVRVTRVDDGPVPPRIDANMLGGFQDGTSRQAAIDHFPRSGTLRRNVLEALSRAGERGATSDELAAAFHWRLYSVKPRLIELRRGGWVERRGDQRPSATGSMVDVYRITDKGRDDLAKAQ